MSEPIVNNLLSRGFYWLLPNTSLYSDLELSRVKIIHTVHLLFLAFSLVFFCTFQYFIAVDDIPAYMPLMHILLLQFVFKRWGNIALSGNLLCLSIFSMLISGIDISGGIYSDNLVWMILLPPLAFLLANRNSGIAWLTVVLAVVVYFYVLELETNSYQERTLKYPADYFLFSWVSLFVFTSLVVLIFANVKNQLILKLKKSEKALLDQKEEILTQSQLARENEKKLILLNEKLEHFAFTISHDLREPLRSIKIYTQLLGKKLDPHLSADNRTYMHFIQTGTDRMNDLIISLLEYSKIEHSHTETKNVSLKDIFLLVKNQLNATINESQPRIEIAKNLQTLKANQALLTILFQNLVNNAIKFRHPERKLHLRIYTEFDSEQNLIVHIQDNGIGIPEKHQQRIFDIFTKLHSKDQYEGSGIGLSTCQKIMTSMNGKIWLDSIPEVGTTFHLLFPRSAVVMTEEMVGP
jgi:signal transduction histidine kinase